MPVKYVAPTVFTWTGCYVGATIGYKWGTQQADQQRLVQRRAERSRRGYDITPSYNLNGVIGGGEAGCNYQVGNWVYGVELDGSWSTAEGQATNINYPGLGFFSPLWVSKTSERWLDDGSWPPRLRLRQVALVRDGGRRLDRR